MFFRKPQFRPRHPHHLPQGFIEEHSSTQLCWLKAGWEETIRAAISCPGNGTIFPVQGGRGNMVQVPIGDPASGQVGEQGSFLIRRYRRGGFVRHFLHETYWAYWNSPLRPLAELEATQTARQRGVPTGEVLGACVEWCSLGLYRGLLISRTADGFVNWWEWLQAQPSQYERQQVATTAAQVVAQLHAVGIEHADLNLTNILVRFSGDTPPQATVLLIDFDRARIFPRPLQQNRCEQNLRRLRRSINKLDPQRQLFSDYDLDLFLETYSSRQDHEARPH
jgi:3-deoxy-D-manno-octulosonic acid kinase